MGWAVVDQGLSSLSNFLLGLMIARLAGAEELGAFTIAYVFYVIVLGISRSFSTDPLLVRSSHVAMDEMRRKVGASAEAALLIGSLGGVAALVIGALSWGATGRALCAVGVFLPVLLVQDAWRFGLFTAGRPRAAAVNDGVWLAAQLVFFVLFASLARVSGAWMVIAWGLGAVPAAVVGYWQTRCVLDWGTGRLWVSRNRDLGLPFAGEFLLTNAGSQLTLFVLGAVAGLAALGGLRAAQLLFGPLTILFLATRSALTPEAARSVRVSPERLLVLVLVISGSLFAVAVALSGLWLVLPSPVGEAILGGTWTEARGSILPLGLAFAAAGAAVGPSVGLRSLEEANRGLAARAAVLPLTLGLALCGVFLGGGRGAAFGLALAALITAGVYADQFRRALAAARVVARHFAAESSQPSRGMASSEASG